MSLRACIPGSLLLLGPFLSAATFTLLNDLPGGQVRGTARALSSDGSIVAGTGQVESGSQAWVWSRKDWKSPPGSQRSKNKQWRKASRRNATLSV